MANKTSTLFNYYTPAKMQILSSCKLDCHYCEALSCLAQKDTDPSDITSESLPVDNFVLPCNAIFNQDYLLSLNSSLKKPIVLQIHSSFFSDSFDQSILQKISPEIFQLEILLDQFTEDLYSKLKQLDAKFSTQYTLLGIDESQFKESLNELPNFILKKLRFSFPTQKGSHGQTLTPDSAYHLIKYLEEYNFKTPTPGNLYEDLSLEKVKNLKTHTYSFTKGDLKPEYSFIVSSLDELDRAQLIGFEEELFRRFGTEAELIVATHSPLIRKHSFGSWQPQSATHWLDIKCNSKLSIAEVFNQAANISKGKKLVFLSTCFLETSNWSQEELAKKMNSSQALMDRNGPLHFLMIEKGLFDRCSGFDNFIQDGDSLAENLIVKFERTGFSYGQFDSQIEQMDSGYAGSSHDLDRIFLKFLSPQTYQTHHEKMGKYRKLRKFFSFIFAPIAFVLNIPPIRFLLKGILWPLRALGSWLKEHKRLHHFLTLRWLNFESLYHFWKVHLYTVFWPYFFLKKHLWRLLEPFHFLKKYFWWVKKPFYYIYHILSEAIARIWLIKKPFYYLYHLVCEVLGRLWIFNQIYYFFKPMYFAVTLFIRDHIWYNLKELGYRSYFGLRRIFYNLRGIYFFIMKGWWYLKGHLWKLRRPFYGPIGFTKSLFQYPEDIKSYTFSKRVFTYLTLPLRKIVWLILYPFRKKSGNEHGTFS